MKVLACVNLKGGVGKTAISVNFAAYCGSIGIKTLLVDLDPQTNATFSCIEVDAWEKTAAEKGTVAHLLGMRSHTSAEGVLPDPASVIIPNVFPNVDLIPSHLDLFNIDLDLAAVPMRETKLRRALQPVLPNYEIVICDCPPNLTIPTQNALALCTHYLVPVSPDYLSVLGVGILLRRVRTLATDMEREFNLAGIVLSRVGRPAAHREENVNTVRQTFDKDVLETELKERVAVTTAASKQKSVYDMTDAAAAQEFSSMSMEVLRKMGVRK
jgi:chromosome partitioning protein